MNHVLSRVGRACAYTAIRSGVAGMSVWELAPTLDAARGLGRAWAGMPFNRKRFNRAVENLSLAFPEWSDEQRRRYAVRAYQHLFELGVEMMHASRSVTEDSWSEHIELGEVVETARALMADGPCIMITGHCGNWELLGYALGLLGFPMYALYRPLDLKPLDRYVRATRERRGLILVDKFGATELLPRVLEAGRSVGFVADQNGGDKGLFVPFFGRLASSYKSIGLMAIEYRARIVCGMARRLTGAERWSSKQAPGMGAGGSSGAGSAWREAGGGMRYRLESADIIDPADWEDHPDPLFYITARYRRAIETMVRRAPEQYLWMHRYWKSRPRHERQGKEPPRALRDKLLTLPWMTEDEADAVLERSRRESHVNREL